MVRGGKWHKNLSNEEEPSCTVRMRSAAQEGFPMVGRNRSRGKMSVRKRLGSEYKNRRGKGVFGLSRGNGMH